MCPAALVYLARERTGQATGVEGSSSFLGLCTFRLRECHTEHTSAVLQDRRPMFVARSCMHHSSVCTASALRSVVLRAVCESCNMHIEEDKRR